MKRYFLSRDSGKQTGEVRHSTGNSWCSLQHLFFVKWCVARDIKVSGERDPADTGEQRAQTSRLKQRCEGRPFVLMLVFRLVGPPLATLLID